jgi:protein-tyrosine phosphatase
VNILFVCSRNRWRSLTAETIFRSNQKHRVKSAGTEKMARIKVTQNLILWAELIFVMEKKHKDRLNEKFGSIMDNKEIVILDIPDVYSYMDVELMEILEASVLPYLDKDGDSFEQM